MSYINFNIMFIYTMKAKGGTMCGEAEREKERGVKKELRAKDSIYVRRCHSKTNFFVS